MSSMTTVVLLVEWMWRTSSSEIGRPAWIAGSGASGTVVDGAAVSIVGAAGPCCCSRSRSPGASSTFDSRARSGTAAASGGGGCWRHCCGALSGSRWPDTVSKSKCDSSSGTRATGPLNYTYTERRKFTIVYQEIIFSNELIFTLIQWYSCNSYSQSIQFIRVL